MFMRGRAVVVVMGGVGFYTIIVCSCVLQSETTNT